MSRAPVVVIGVGNAHRRDDGIGPAVAAAVAARGCAGVRVVRCAAEPAALIDAWDGADLAVLVDAGAGPAPGRVRRCTPAEIAAETPVSSHDLNLAQTYELALALGRAPGSVVVIAVDVADTGYGDTFSPAVGAALGEAERMVLDVLRQGQEARNQHA